MARTLPQTTTIYRIVGIGLGFALAAFAAAAFAPSFLVTLLDFVFVPLLIAFAVWVVVVVVRLWVVGILPSDADHFVPTALLPWIDFWLLVRSGLSGAMLLLLLAILATAIANGPVRYCFQGLVYIAMIHVFANLGVNAALNVVFISHRHRAG